MPPKAKSFRFRATSPSAWFESRSCGFILAANWVFQGIRGMDPKEASFRLMLLFGIAAVATWLLTEALMLMPLEALGLGLLIGHSFNFLANGQFWVCCRYCPAYRREPKALRQGIEQLLDELKRAHWLDEAVMIGSTVTRIEAPGARSDIDLRLVFTPGVLGWWRTNWLLLRLRFTALICGLPLDLYAYEHPATLRRFDQTEPMGIILDRKARLRRGFANRELVWLR